MAVGGVGPAGAEGDGGGIELGDVEGVQAGGGGGDVDDGVDGADLVEVDLVGGGAVDFGFGFGEAGEDVDRGLLDLGREVGGFDEGADVGEAAVVGRRSRASVDRSASRGQPASTRQPRNMSPERPEGRSR